MEFLWFIYGCAVVFFIIGSIGAIVEVSKRRKRQRQTKYNFSSKKGNYKFFYSIKCFRTEDGVIAKIITDANTGFSDIAYYKTNKFEDMQIYIDDKKLEISLKKDLYKAMAECLIPSEYINGSALSINFTIKTRWYFSEKTIEDTLSFVYEETL